MPSQTISITDDGAIRIELVDESEDMRAVEFVPTTNGKMDITVETPDGTRKTGTIEPGAGNDTGVGQ
jgi:hypothetical protein